MPETLAEAPFATTDGLQRHASYAALAATAPVHRITLPTGQSAWLITGYNEARHALHDPRLVKSEVTAANTGRDLLPGEVYAAMGSHMLNLNPPDHTRLRRLVATAFTRRRIDQLTPRIQQITNDLLDAIVTDAQLDLIDSFALPLPITVICELLGVPTDRRTEFHHWSSIVITGVLAGPDKLAAAATAMVSYLRELVEAKRAVPTDDLLSALVAARDGEDRLSEDELTSMVFMIIRRWLLRIGPVTGCVATKQSPGELWTNRDLVFSTSIGTPIEHRSLNTHWEGVRVRPACQEFGFMT